MNETGFSKLVKTSASNGVLKLTGAQKAAILFAELGETVTSRMTDSFSTKQLHILRTAMNNLGPIDTKTEIAVLEQALDYGSKNGLWDQAAAIKTDVAKRSTTLRSAASSNPSAMAGLISSWLETGDDGDDKPQK